MFKVGQKLSFKSHRKRTIAILLVIVLVAGLAGYGIYRHYHPTSVKTADGKEVKLKPATEEEKQQADDNKSAIVKRSEQLKQAAAANSSGQTPSSVVITSADASGVRAYVTGVFEEGGTCTATAQGPQTVSGSSIGFQNVSYTQCPFIEWPSPLSPGTWNITVSYKSAATSSTQSTTIEVK